MSDLFYLERVELKTGIVTRIGNDGLDRYTFVAENDPRAIGLDHACASKMVELLEANHNDYKCWSMNRHIPNYEFRLKKCD